MSNKHCIFISSTGRTGTQFFGKILSYMIKDCSSFHEPDTTWITRPLEWTTKIFKYGLYRMTIGQFSPKYQLYKLSTERIRGNISDEQAIEYIRNLREKFISKAKTSIYIESNHLYYGLLDLLDSAFKGSKFIYIIRDPRTWIKSALNTKAYLLYSLFDRDFLNMSLRAYNFDDDPYANKWKEMSLFEKACWYYTKVNNISFELLEKVNDYKIYRYEDLFINKGTRDKEFNNLLKYISSLNNGFKINYTYKPELLDKKVHSTSKKSKLSKWTEWDNENAKILQKHCGKIMKKFNYGNEPEWKEKLV